jgi:serine/threonine protein kinase
MDENSITDRQDSNEESTESIFSRVLSKSGFVLRGDRSAEPEPEKKPVPILKPVIEQKVFFKNVQFLKAGGMANLYTAVLNDPQSRWHDRKVVIKRIIPEKTEDENYRELFYKEYLLLRDMDHENIVSIISRGEDDTGHYYLTEYINGKNLNELIETNIGLTKKDGKRKRLSEIISGILHGIQGIHEAGIIHRDITPANIIISSSTNKVKIIDFGLAKSDAIEDKLLVAGSPPYASPEQQYNAFSVDNRTDIYSFGIVLLELMTGSNDKALGNSLKNIFPYLVEIINKCTEELPENRYNYISEILDDFSQSEVRDELKICGEKTVIELNKESKSKTFIKSDKKKEKPEIIRRHQSSKSGIYIFIIGLIVLTTIILFFTLSPSKSEKKTVSIEFDAKAGEIKTLDINYSGNWNIQLTMDWIEVNKLTENKNQIIVKTLSDNISQNERVGVLKIVDDNGIIIKSLDVKQFGVAPHLSVAPNKIIFDHKINQPFIININSNLPWTAETDLEWIHINPNKGSKEQKISISAKYPNLKEEAREGKVIIKAEGLEKTETIFIVQNAQMLIEFDKPFISFDKELLKSEKIIISSNTTWKFGKIPSFLKMEPVSGPAGKTEVNIFLEGETTEESKVIVNVYAAKSNSVINSITIEFNEPDVETPTVNQVTWNYEDLKNYINKIRNTSAPVNFNELFTRIDPKCRVYYYINGKKITNSDDIKTFINKIKLGGQEKAVENSIVYNSEGKITEFCQE